MVVSTVSKQFEIVRTIQKKVNQLNIWQNICKPTPDQRIHSWQLPNFCLLEPHNITVLPSSALVSITSFSPHTSSTIFKKPYAYELCHEHDKSTFLQIAEASDKPILLKAPLSKYSFCTKMVITELPLSSLSFLHLCVSSIEKWKLWIKQNFTMMVWIQSIVLLAPQNCFARICTSRHLQLQQTQIVVAVVPLS